MKNTRLLFIGLLLGLFACGPSQQEIEKQKEIADSIKQAKEDSVKLVQQKLELERIHKEKIEVGKSLKRDQLNKVLDKLNANLERANKKLEDINVWQLGRSYDLKQSQIANQRQKINELEECVERVKRQISLTHLFESFEFQGTPEETVNHIFESAKSKDYSKMRHLIDPYGEFDESALEVCYPEMLTDRQRQRWNETFEKGRIIGNPKYSVSKSEVQFEIATGFNSDQIESIELINRYGKWYIKKYGQLMYLETQEEVSAMMNELEVEMK